MTVDPSTVAGPWCSSIVAIIRDGQSIPAPGPEFGLLAGDVIVAVGTTEGLAAMRELVRR